MESFKWVKQICDKYGGDFDSKRSVCIIPPEKYRKLREDYQIDFILESDELGVSLVSKKDDKYYIENWNKPRRPLYGGVPATLIREGRENWELIEFRPINRIERNKLLGRDKKK